jgi:hypothetical protein
MEHEVLKSVKTDYGALYAFDGKYIGCIQGADGSPAKFQPPAIDAWIHCNNFVVLEDDAKVFGKDFKVNDLIGSKIGCCVAFYSHDPAYEVILSWIEESRQSELERRLPECRRLVEQKKPSGTLEMSM